MPFTDIQEKVIKDSLPDIYQQLAELQESVSELETENKDLKERMNSFDNWRKALRLRIRQEGSAV
jgi:prefoldin subunit 5